MSITRVNWFQVVIGVLNIGAAIVALNQGNPKIAALFCVYTLASFVLAVM